MIIDIRIVKSYDAKCRSNVTIENVTVPIDWWYAILTDWGQEGRDDYLYAEAYKATGNLQAAKDLLEPKATGNLQITEEEVESEGEMIMQKVITDTRNWYQNWLDNNM
jgi:hypothetical protein